MNGFVYIMRCGNYAKIGYSRDPRKRMVQMDRCLPVQPTLVAIYPGSRAIETKLHRHLARYHCRYEWFRWCADIEVIASRGLPRSFAYRPDATNRAPTRKTQGTTGALEHGGARAINIALTRRP